MSAAAVVIGEMHGHEMPSQQSPGFVGDFSRKAAKVLSPGRYVPSPIAGGMAFYRKYTERLLGRYMRTSMQMGRSPSVLGNLVIRGRATHTGVRNFEDAIIFVHDMDNCLKKLDSGGRELVSRIALQEFTQQEVGDMLGMSARSVVRRYLEAIDRLTEILLEVELMEEMI